MAFKNCKIMRKCVFLFNGLELEKVLELRPLLFFNFFFTLLQFFPIPARFWDMILSKIMIFEKNPFTTAVSIPTFEIHQPTLLAYIYPADGRFLVLRLLPVAQ